MFRLIVLSSLIIGAIGQVQLEGVCRKPEHVASNVNILSFIGNWYQIERVPNPREPGVCSFSAFYAFGSTFGMVFNYAIYGDQLIYRSGTIRQDSNDLDKFVVSYADEVAEYYVLSTDNKEYVLLYSCANTSNGNRNVLAWKMSRSRQYSSTVQQEVQAAVDQNPELRNATWHVVNQNNCLI